MESRRVQLRRGAAGVTLVVGLLLFNWWLALPWVVGGDRILDRLLSDATAVGAQSAATLRVMEGTGAVLLLVALLLRGPADRVGAVRRDWWWAVVLVVFEFVDSLFVEACQSGTDRGCFEREVRLQLPWYHYLHIAGGAIEWIAAILVAWTGWRRLRGTSRGSIYGWLLVYGAVVLAPLALAFVTHRLFSVVEFTVYVAFSIVLVLTVTEPAPDRS